jgi:hypothetical protein
VTRLSGARNDAHATNRRLPAHMSFKEHYFPGVQTYRRPSPADAGDHGGAWLLPFPVWLQLGVRAALRSFLVDLFVPKIKLRERERVWTHFVYVW